jgi:hypothetical protein
MTELDERSTMEDVEDPFCDARMKAINGLARRRDERVRSYLMRELEGPEHSEHPKHSRALDEAIEALGNGAAPD